MQLLEWWGGLPWLVRYGVAFLFIGTGAVLFFTGAGMRLPIIGWAIGGAMLLMAGRSDSEKRGYNF